MKHNFLFKSGVIFSLIFTLVLFGCGKKDPATSINKPTRKSKRKKLRKKLQH